MEFERRMVMYNDLLNFLATEECFIEAEARPDKMQIFLNDYNHAFGEALTFDSDGLIVLQPDANKWAVELRLYVNNCPDDIKTRYGFAGNRAYRPEYSFRMNNNSVIKQLFNCGYRIGLNI